ncbi:GDSL esterase/lipase at3g48460 [Phtheirospermum japonicum]|uniref:GDSL esterase/lipase at3g48460 n=1 Tax=Phtheirospermum japonicum TaxID=374723 RepID=A0A830BBI1_9LAMI|nr:GDSL esterase/lipase at3g48460 [Phtheirospermum japonicum]
MASTNISLTISLVLILLSSASPALCSAGPSPFKKLYAFGDSYTDTGNTMTSTGPTAFNYVSNPPYGVTFFHHPTNRYSDGRIVVDFVAEALSLPYLPPYRNPKANQSHGLSFAVGGATAIRHGFFLKNNITFNLVRQSLQTQLVWFNNIMESKGCKDSKTTPSECKAVLGDSLIWLGEIGANDYTCSLGSSLSSQVIQDLAINSVAGFLQVLLSKGAKYIIVQGLPPTGCAPYSFSLASPDDRDEMGCVASMNRIALAHNAALQARLSTIKSQNPQSVIVYADYYNSHLTLLQNPTKYGFKQSYRACCGYGGGPYNFDVFNPCGSASSTSCADPGEYVNWDGAHFTEAAYKVITDSFLKGKFCSPSFDYLLRKKVQMG